MARTVFIDFDLPNQMKPKFHPDAVKVSNSSIKTWRKCKREYFYKFVMKLEKKAKPAPLYKGSVIHEILEERIEGRSWKMKMNQILEEFDKLFDEEKDEYGRLDLELPTIIEGYHHLYKNDGLEYLDIDGKKAEHDIYVALDGKPIEESLLVYTGKIDTIALDSEGRTWLMDHKTFSSMPDENFRFTNQQILLYAWAMEKMGLPKPDGVIWDYIRTKVPSKPDLLKNGTMTKKQLDTTYKVYYDALVENDLDPDDYQDYLDNLKGREGNFYRRIYLPINEAMIEPVVEDLIETAKEIAVLHDITKARNLDRHCTFCSFRMVCQSDLQGLDTDFILNQYYAKSTYHLNVESEEEVV